MRRRCLAGCLLIVWQLAAAEQSDDYYALPLDELLRVQTAAKASVGSRSGARGALDAEVPIDVISAEQLQSVGQPELARALAAILPGFNYPRPSIADGSDHAPPFTLRALNPDQVLVLVNGKRLHQSSLLHVNGTIGRGSSSADLNTIPLRAVERVEILRDGAAAQYGSDAIAGIINVVLKGYGQKSRASLTYGRSSKGDGIVRQADVFYALPLAGDGFANFTLELRGREPTNRAGGDPLDGGRKNLRFGDPEADDALLSFNAEKSRSDTTFYAHGHFNQRRSSAGALFRRSDDERNLSSVYPNGFLPRIEPKIRDHSLTIGARGLFSPATGWNFSYTDGANNFHFYVAKSLNRSLGSASPSSFDSGATRFSQRTLNFDLTHQLGEHSLAGGIELRRERYRISAGDAASYILGPDAEWYAGAQGFAGFAPENTVGASRSSHAAYADLKYAVSRRLTLDLASRAEHFSDFGSTVNGKLALRLRATDDLLLRSSLSSGFRAPSLTQTDFSSTSTLRNGESISRYGTFRVDHPVAAALGANDLKAEKSRHFTLGAVYKPTPGVTASADYFITDIDDRIMATGYIADWSLADLSPQALAIMQRYRVDGATYFTNAIGTRSRGFDLRLDAHQQLANGASLTVKAAYQRASTRIKRVNGAPPVLGVDMTELILDPYTRVTLEEGQPRDSFAVWAKYAAQSYHLVLNVRRYGSYASTSEVSKVKFAARWTVDGEFSYRLARDYCLSVGANNIFNVKPQEWGVTSDSLTGNGKPIRYSQYAPFGYNGAAYYLRFDAEF